MADSKSKGLSSTPKACPPSTCFLRHYGFPPQSRRVGRTGLLARAKRDFVNVAVATFGEQPPGHFSLAPKGIEAMNVATAVAAVDVESRESIHRWKYCTEATMHGTSLRSGAVACVVESIFSSVLKVC